MVPTEQNRLTLRPAIAGDFSTRSTLKQNPPTVEIPRAVSPIEIALLVAYMLVLFGLLHPDEDSTSTTQLLIFGPTYIITLISLFVERKRAAQLFGRALPLIAIVILILFSFTWSDYGSVTLTRAWELTATTISAYAIVCRYRLEHFLIGLCLATLIAAVLSAIEVMIAHEAGGWQGIFVQKNTLGQAMALGVITLLTLALRDVPRVARILLYSSSLLCGVLLLGSQSVTSWIIFATLGCVLGILGLRRSRIGARVLPIVVLAFTLILIAAWLNLPTLLDVVGKDATLSGRTEIWPLILECIAKRPILGYGYDSFWLPDGSGSAYLPVLLKWQPFTAHDGLLELCLDVGVVGVVVFVIVLATSFWRAARAAVMQIDLIWAWPFLAIVYFILSNITEASIAKYNVLNWVVFVVASLYASQPRLHPAAPTSIPFSAGVRENSSEGGIRAYVAPFNKRINTKRIWPL